MHKFNFLAKTVLGAAVSLGCVAAMPSAHAASLIPQMEGEISTTNLGCLDATQCINTSTLGYQVTSLAYGDSNKYQGRLFVDKTGTANSYSNGGLSINFGQTDAGTNGTQFWFRPVALENGTAIEGGQLESGKFLFEFDQEYSEISLDFFDVESTGFSGILELNGQALNQTLNAGDNNGTQRLTLKNVKSFIVQLGQPNSAQFQSTGDGVLLSGLNGTKTASVPEPGTVVSLSMLGVAGVFGLRKRKKAAVAM
ncbi:LEVG family PEP-CTERM protein [Calothrix sp. 336/3]|uniref:LEVG family PEP-CTERM protein n=1 Tax=Calothrix sp. 336/3 TaxID=1337936 RepID=UPI0004E40079|nr:LEVG family PEP-CTERM protein [Calothrix sp. 336/3]AKG22888.1 exosortase [Calothrix sp. 336/3]